MLSRLSQREDGVGREKLAWQEGFAAQLQILPATLKRCLATPETWLLTVILEETVHTYQGLFELIRGGTIGTADESCASSAK